MFIGWSRTFMQKYRNAFVGVIGILILGFVVIYGGGSPQGGGPREPSVIAVVDGIEIDARTYQNQYRSLVRTYRQTYGEQFQMLAQNLNLEEQAFTSVKQNALLQLEAKKMGLKVTEADVRQYLFSMPVFQENGVFSRDRYLMFLRNSGRRAPEFEEDLKKDILVQKARDAIRSMVTVAKAEVWNDYKRQNEKAIIEYAVFKPSDFEEDVEVAEEEIRARYDEDPTSYIVPTRVKMEYVYLTRNKIASEINPTGDEIRAYYEANKDDPRFQQEEEVRARHILIQVGQDASAEETQRAREQAETLLADIQGGADFATLAQNNSDDPGSAAKGGDLGFFGRGRMVPPFEEAAFSLAPGEVSDIVQSQFGFHIIKVEERREPGQKSLDQVRSTVVQAIKNERATARLDELTAKMDEALRSGKTVAEAAEMFDLEVKESPYFEKGGSLADVPKPQQFDEWAFSAEVGDNNGGMDVFSLGRLYARITDRIEEHQGTFEEVRNDIRDTLEQEMAADVAAEKAQEVYNTVQMGTPLEQAAIMQNGSAKTSQSFARGGFIQDLGRDEQFHEKVFSTPEGELGPVVELANGNWVAFTVEEITTAERAKFEAEYPKLKGTMMQRKQSTFLSWYLQNLEEEANVQDFRQPANQGPAVS